MDKDIYVLGIAGSLRRGSYNAALLRAAADLAPRGMAIEMFDLSPIPLYNADVQAEGDPEPVQQFKHRIAAADAVLIATPEYNYSIPGVLKNALDWASRPVGSSPLNDKPLAIMGAGGRMGTSRAQYHLRQIAVVTNMHPLNKPEVQVSFPADHFDADGRLQDEHTAKLVRDLLSALDAWTRRLRGESWGS